MLKTFIVLCSVVFTTSAAVAGSIDLPKVKPGDSWICKTTVESGRTGWLEKHKEFTVIHTTPSGILLSTKEVGSKLPPEEQLIGSDWSIFKNIEGLEVTVSKPFKFPLYEGKSWKINYTENHPAKGRKYQRIQLEYKVAGWEEVEVPAGKFHALKIEAEGNWEAEIEPSVSTMTSTRADSGGITTAVRTSKTPLKVVTGRLYKSFWYVPNVKRFVKLIEEDFSVQGARNGRYTLELESYKVSE